MHKINIVALITLSYAAYTYTANHSLGLTTPPNTPQHMRIDNIKQRIKKLEKEKFDIRENYFDKNAESIASDIVCICCGSATTSCLCFTNPIHAFTCYLASSVLCLSICKKMHEPDTYDIDGKIEELQKAL